MGVVKYAAAKAPEGWVFIEEGSQHPDNRDALLFAGGDDPRDDLDYPDDDMPALDPYSVQFEHTMAFKCDDTLRDWIDAIGAEHDFSRSEILRRLVFLGITKLDGRIERVRFTDVSEPTSEAA